jgi:hypothetical protein
VRAWPLHALFATILIGSLAARDQTADVLAASDNLAPAVLSVARSHGLNFNGYTTIHGTDVGAFVFNAPDCSQPILVVLLLVTFDQEPIVRSTREQRYKLRYIYIDRTWEEPDRLAVFGERIKYALLGTLGLTRYRPSWHLLLVEAPSSCHVADAIDWRNVWDRDYPGAAEVNVETKMRLKINKRN